VANLGDHPDIGVASPAGDLASAYQRLLADLETALWYDDDQVAEAYREYTDAHAQALSDPLVSERVSRALDRLTAALALSLERGEARAAVERASADYLRDVGDAWPRLRASESEVESLTAVATGMTTLAWLFGLGASGLITPFGSADLFPTAAVTGSWSTPAGDAGGSGWGTPSGSGAAPDDGGIVWQEFAVGDDGEIVERAAPAGGRGTEAPGPTGGDTAGPAAADPGHDGDPVDAVERAYAAYLAGLRSSGAVVTTHPDPAVPSPPAPAEVERGMSDLAASYLRWTQGVGSLPDLYGAYARFLGGATALIGRQLDLIQGYERLMALAAQGRSPDQVRRTADAHYRRFLAALREGWAGIDPSDLPPDRLSALVAMTTQAAALHEEATGIADRPSPT
jgi:hypothetical protein